MGRSVVRVVGDCMAPRLMPGDLLCLDADRPCRTGDLVVAVVAGGVTLIGQVAEWEGARWLIGQHAEPIHLGAGSTIVGVADGVLRQV